MSVSLFLKNKKKVYNPSNNKNYRLFNMVAREGFEPSQAESESAVLPLHNLALATFLLYYISLESQGVF